MTRELTKELIILQRYIQWAYKLEQYEAEAILQIQKPLRQSIKELMAFINQNWSQSGALTRQRAIKMVDELRNLYGGIVAQVGGNIAMAAAEVGAASLTQYADILSFGGRVTSFNSVSLSAAQLRSIATETPVGGKLLNEWVQDAFDYRMQQQIKEEIMAGLLKGESYPKLFDRFKQGFSELTDQEITTLLRTYTQSANVGAQQATYEANKDLVKRVRWNSVLENSSRSGRGTCLFCLSMSDQEFPVDNAPPCPAHPRCRCGYLPVLPKISDIPGLENWESVENVYKPYTKRDLSKRIDTGRRNTILEVGFHDGNYESWMKTRSKKFQINALGPSRYELWKSGKVKLQDMIEPYTGKVIPLKELNA